MKRNFPIPVAMVGLTGCGGFQFEGVWDLNKVEIGPIGEPFEYSQDFPYTEYGETLSLEMTVDESSVNLEQITTYENGSAPYSYTEGPHTWSETEKGRFVMAGDFDGDSFICDGDTATPDSLLCQVLFEEDDEYLDLYMSRSVSE